MEDQPENDNTQQIPCHTVTKMAMVGIFKPDRFDMTDPSNWFITFEANMRIYNIPNSCQFDYLLCTLHSGARAPIAHQLTAPPEDLNLRYEWLKELLISGHTKSRRQKLQQLLQGERIGDRKPTAFLAHLRELAPDSVDDELVKEIWWKELPSTARAVLSAITEADLRKLAEAADSVHEELEERQRVDAIRAPAHSAESSVSQQLAKLTDMITELLTEWKKNQRPFRGSSRPRQPHRGRSRERDTAPQPSSTGQDVCFYHRKFGAKAQSCQKPCNWAGN